MQANLFQERQKMNNFGLTDRIISVLTYYTFGGAGVIWLIVCALSKTNIPKFTKFHILQSIFLSIILYFITLLIEICFGFAISVPFIGEIIKKIIIYSAQTPIYLGFSLVHYVVFIILTYLAVFALLGKYSYFPYISEMTKTNLGDR